MAASKIWVTLTNRKTGKSVRIRAEQWETAGVYVKTRSLKNALDKLGFGVVDTSHTFYAENERGAYTHHFAKAW